MALSDTTHSMLWLHTFMSELDLDITPIPMCVDNQGAIFMAQNPVQDKRTKHIDIRHHFIREHVFSGLLKLYHVSTGDMIADVLTKPLALPKFLHFHALLGLRTVL